MSQCHRCQGREGRGTEHHRAPGGQGRGDLAGPHRRREVPGGDHGDHPDRAVRDDRPGPACRGGAETALGAHGFLGEPSEELRRVEDLRPGVVQGLAVLGADEHRELLGLSHHEVEQGPQQLCALPGRGGAPGRQRLGGRVDGACGIRRSRIRAACEYGVAGGVDDVEGSAVGRCRHPPAQEHPLLGADPAQVVGQSRVGSEGGVRRCVSCRAGSCVSHGCAP